MILKIIEVNYPKIKVELDGKIKDYEVENFVNKDFVKLGIAEVTFNNESKMISFIKMQPTSDPYASKQNSTNQSKSKDSDVIDIKGKDYMTYTGLLKKAHEKGKFSMVILEKYVSEDMKKAWCIVRLTTNEQIFDGFGSSTPDNTGQMTQSHPVEMCHTRAKGRALRDYLNIGEVMAEELK